MAKTMAPFPTLPPRSCRNTECSKTCPHRKAEKDETGRHLFTPRTPWQQDCSPECRNHWNYITKTKPERQAKRSEKSVGENSNAT